MSCENEMMFSHEFEAGKDQCFTKEVKCPKQCWEECKWVQVCETKCHEPTMKITVCAKCENKRPRDCGREDDRGCGRENGRECGRKCGCGCERNSCGCRG